MSFNHVIRLLLLCLLCFYLNVYCEFVLKRKLSLAVLLPLYWPDAPWSLTKDGGTVTRSPAVAALWAGSCFSLVITMINQLPTEWMVASPPPFTPRRSDEEDRKASAWVLLCLLLNWLLAFSLSADVMSEIFHFSSGGLLGVVLPLWCVTSSLTSFLSQALKVLIFWWTEFPMWWWWLVERCENISCVNGG